MADQNQLNDILQTARTLVSLLGNISPDGQTPAQSRQVQVQVEGQGHVQARQGNGQPSGAQVQNGQPDGRRSVHQELTRSFPGLFRREARGRKRFMPYPKPQRTFLVNFFLLDEQRPRTPRGEEELQLMLAGLGKRCLTVAEDVSHSKLTDLLLGAFPKLSAVSGGWLIYKSSGGGGQRKLAVVPPESEGYNGQQIRVACGNGKCVLYIAPIQEQLDMTPLPPDAEEFRSMPKAACGKCGVMVPLQGLPGHVNNCNSIEICSSSEEDSDSQRDEMEVTAECPVCGKAYPTHSIEAHAADCGDASSSAERSSDLVYNETATATGANKSTEDVLQSLVERVDAGKEFALCIDRQDLMESTLSQWRRKKNSSPVNVLKVVFLGEAGVDTGALRKEFLTDVMTALEDRFFEGPGDQGKWPKYSTSDLETDNFRTVGEIMALSLAQGGPPPAFLKNWCFNILCHGEVEYIQLTESDVADYESAELIKAVENCSDVGALLERTDEIINCGYSKLITLKNKASIIRAIVLHSTMRVIPMLLQLRKGLQLYGLQSQMATYPEACRGLFVPGSVEQPDADFILMNCKADYSERGSQKEREERKIMKFLQDFLEQIEAEEVWEESVDGPDESTTQHQMRLTVGDILKWMSGQAHKPILPAEKREFKITVQFEHDCSQNLGEHKVCYPTVSACTQTITMPVQHLSTFENFKAVFGRAICGSAGFHRV